MVLLPGRQCLCFREDSSIRTLKGRMTTEKLVKR